MIFDKSRAECVLVFERSRTGYSAYAQTCPACISTGSTPEHTKAQMDEAIFGHLRMMRAKGQRVPRPGPLGNYAPRGLLLAKRCQRQAQIPGSRLPPALDLP
jgi:predicted RNase H-like HicB family nuclease